MSTKHILFVYGTLKKGESNHDILSCDLCQGGHNSCYRFLGSARTIQRFDMYCCGSYPIAVVNPLGAPIEGEVYEINDQTLAFIDELEGHPDFYRRRQIVLDTGHMAWVYIWNREQLDFEQLVSPSGGFLRWSGHQQCDESL